MWIGMKCIENHPQRNALVTGGASSSTRSLQVTIEALKRELLMRDAIHSYSSGGGGGGVYTETLTAQQQSATIDMACTFAQSGSSPSAQESLAGLDLRSLAQAQGVAAALRSALWVACGGDGEKVEAALQGMRSSTEGETPWW